MKPLGRARTRQRVRAPPRLERRAVAPTGVGANDQGTGAFDPMAMSELPDIYEDLLYKEEQERLAAALAAADDGATDGGRTFLDLVEARLAASTAEDPGSAA